MSLLVRRGASAVSGKGRGEDKFVGQGKLWTQHPSGPGSPRAARDCASKLERDAGTVTARYAMHISSLLAKPYVIARPSYVQLKEAFSPAGTRTGGLTSAARRSGMVALVVLVKLKKKRNFELEDTVLVGSPP